MRHDADKGEYAFWWFLLRPADDDQDDVPPPATAPTVTVSVAADATRIEDVRPVGTETDLFDDFAAACAKASGRLSLV
ncbi:hypothetical protein [Streptomyces cremeus]|uniref:Uncharacterized protein n=1 Tax=Streptomyces cremeus TaxID=66881 RepID=A0ABV5PNS7_STRCM